MSRSLADCLQDLVTVRNDFVTNLNTVGLKSDEAEGFNSLVPKILNVERAYGGNYEYYREEFWTLSEDPDIVALGGINQVRLYTAEMWNGGGSVLIVFSAKNDEIPSMDLVLKVQDKVDPSAFGQGKGNGIAPIGHYVTVVGVNGNEITLTLKLTLGEGVVLADLQPVIEESVKSYFTELNSTWESICVTGEECLEITKENLVNACTVTGVTSVDSVKINGTVLDTVYTLDDRDFAVLKTLELG